MRSHADFGTSTSALAYLAELARVLPLVPDHALAEAIEILLEARATGRRIYVMGNGGSASTASHLVCDLVKSAAVEGFAPLKAFTLADNTALLTAWANDWAYERIFVEQVVGLIEPGDVLIAISASGNSRNIVAALSAANSLGAHTIGLLGFDGGAALELVDVAIHIPCADYGLVEDTHAAIGHAMTAAIRQTLERETAEPVLATAARGPGR
jgi:D-sedoheptulose 7-phosphate isomerase